MAALLVAKKTSAHISLCEQVNHGGILHVSDTATSSGFGLSECARNLTDAMTSIGMGSTLLTTDTRDELLADLRVSKDEGMAVGGGTRFANVFPAGRFTSWPMRYSNAMTRLVRAYVNQSVDPVIYVHGLWGGASLSVDLSVNSGSAKIIVSPQGTLDPWAYSKSRFKKQVALRIWTRRLLNKATCIHAASPEEAKAIRRFGISTPIALISNGIPSGLLDACVSAEEFRQELGASPATRLIAYMGRVTPKKGLDLLIPALAAHATHARDWKLVIAGPDDRGFLQSIMRLADSLNIGGRVSYIGTLHGEKRLALLSAADVFALPSRGEGKPVAVLEAAAAGVPLLVTDTCYCDFVERVGCGWQVSATVEDLVAGVSYALSATTERLAHMSRQGRRYSQQFLTWDALAYQHQNLVEWCRSRAEMPAFVEL